MKTAKANGVLHDDTESQGRKHKIKRSCETCHLRKVKCSLEKPSCSACHRHTRAKGQDPSQVACLYAVDPDESLHLKIEQAASKRSHKRHADSAHSSSKRVKRLQTPDDIEQAYGSPIHSSDADECVDDVDYEDVDFSARADADGLPEAQVISEGLGRGRKSMHESSASQRSSVSINDTVSATTSISSYERDAAPCDPLAAFGIPTRMTPRSLFIHIPIPMRSVPAKRSRHFSPQGLSINGDLSSRRLTQGSPTAPDRPAASLYERYPADGSPTSLQVSATQTRHSSAGPSYSFDAHPLQPEPVVPQFHIPEYIVPATTGSGFYLFDHHTAPPMVDLGPTLTPSTWRPSPGMTTGGPGLALDTPSTCLGYNTQYHDAAAGHHYFDDGSSTSPHRS